MGKHKKHKKHHSHPHPHGSKDIKNADSAEMKVTVPLQSLYEPEAPPSPQLPVTIHRALLHPSHPHSTQTPTHSEHKHHKKHKKKHKKHHTVTDTTAEPPKIAPLRIPVPKPDPPPSHDAIHAHTKHHKHKHKRSHDTIAAADEDTPQAKRQRIDPLELTEGETPLTEEHRLVTPLHLQLPPSTDIHKHKKKKKKHKSSSSLTNNDDWEPINQPKSHTPSKTIASEPQPSEATPTKVDHPPVHSSPGKQMRLLRDLEQSVKEKTPIVSKKQSLPTDAPQVEIVQLTKATPPAPPPAPPRPKVPHVKLSESALKFFLKNLHHLIQKRDPESVFSEPVTDDIAPNYSTIITHPMDLATMATKIENSQYPSINEFKADFELMCINAMTYNGPETAYYSIAKQLLSNGLQIIAKETSLRPDILHGRLVDRGQSSSPLPSTTFHLPSSTGISFDPESPFLCRFPLSLMSGSRDDGSIIDVSSLGEIKDQSHLTRVEVGVSSVSVGEELLEEVLDSAEAIKENLDTNYPSSKFVFVNRDDKGHTMLNLMDPESSTLDYSKPVDLTLLSNKIRMGNNAATVLKTELPMMKATPVSYLMYGPFGSFAPAYDSAFASLAKVDSEQLLSTYGNELGVSYAHSLQQFVKGTSSFVSEMADAVLNQLTHGRHSKFVEKTRNKETKTVPTKDANKSPPTVEKNIKQEEHSEVGVSSEKTTPAPVEATPPLEESLPAELESDATSTPQLTQDKEEVTSTRETSVSRATSPLSGSEHTSRSGSVSSSRVSSEATEETVDDKLQATSELLTELQDAQQERLSLPPAKDSSGQLLLAGPSQKELDAAAEVRKQLTTLTAQALPRDVVKVDTLHEVMGISEASQPSQDSSPQTMNTNTSSA